MGNCCGGEEDVVRSNPRRKPHAFEGQVSEKKGNSSFALTPFCRIGIVSSALTFVGVCVCRSLFVVVVGPSIGDGG